MASNKDSDVAEDPMIEIKLHEVVRKSEITDDSIRSMIIKCSACAKQINPHSKNLKKHAQLKVLVCKECSDFYSSGEFSQDEDGDKYCRWCGNGGKLFGCDFCTNSFCIPCVRRNFGRGEVGEIKDKAWKCYCCEPSKLKQKIAFCDIILEYSKDQSRWQCKKPTTHSSSSVVNVDFEDENFLVKAFEAIETMCSKFQHRISTLKSIHKSNSKSEKRVFVKLMQVAESYTNEMNHMKKKFHRFSSALAQKSTECVRNNNAMPHEDKPQNMVNSNSSNSIVSSLDDNLDNIPTEVDHTTSKDVITEENNLNDKNNHIKDTNNSDLVIIDEETNAKPPSDSEPDSISILNSAKDLAPECTTVSEVSEDTNFKADGFAAVIKSTLFSESEDSSDSSLDLPDLGNLDSNCSNKDQEEKDLTKCKSVQENETKPIKDGDDILKAAIATPCFHDKKNNRNESSKKNKCLSSGSSSSISIATSSDSENELKFKSVKRKLFRKKTVRSGPLSSKSKNMEELLKCPKLKMEPYVLLEKVDLTGAIPKEAADESEAKPSILKTESDDELEKLKKAVDSLSRLPKVKRAKEKEEATESLNEDTTEQVSVKKKSEKPKNLKTKTKDEKEKSCSASSSAIEFSSSDEDHDIMKKAVNATIKEDDLNELAKKSLLEKPESSEESSSDSSSSEIIAVPKTKKKVVKKDSNSSSSDEFQPRKKSKYEKLLHIPLNESDDEKKKEKVENKETKKAEKKKKNKRKHSSSSSDKKSTDSSSDDSSSSDEKRKKSKPKKRRRIKSLTDSSDDGDGKKDSDVEIIGSQDTPSGKGRKNIRKVISKKKLGDDTKEAQMTEKERKRRLQERQKLYNKITDTSEDGTQIITRKMVLEVDPESKEEVVEIHPDIVEKLKPHQINGVKFMWECTIESLKELETKPGSGCILAHCMGLGKTLQVIAFLYTCMTNKYVSKHIKRAMIICPYNTVLNWEREFEIWLENAEDEIMLHQMAIAKDNDMRLDILKYWEKEGGALIISYDIFRRLMEGKMQRFPKKSKEKLFKILTTAADIVVCDEGHILKNETSSTSKATSKLKTQRRIVLTGTPLQNNLKEYHCMVQFVKPSLLGNSKEFRNRFVNPISNGQYDDSSERDVKLMKKRVHILHKLLDGCVQRCDYSTLTKFLPPKHEFVISVRLSEVQIKMYRHYLEQISESKRSGKIEGRTLFSDYNSLKNIWTYPFICHLSHTRLKEKRERLFDSEEENDSFIDDSSDESGSDSSKSEDEVVPTSPKPGTSHDKDNSSSEDEVVKVYKTRSRTTKDKPEEEEEAEPEVVKSITNQWYHEFISDEDKFNIALSGKMVLLLDILKECEAIGDKIIVFSQSLLTLDVIEDILEYMDEKPLTEEDKERDVIGTWVKGLDYFRMDGSTSADFRKKWIELFNNPKNERARLFLISTKAGSLGTNLIGANRVVILDASWNPSHDVQAIFRVYRFGQNKPVYIYRLLAQGTMEEKIYDRQVTKLSLSIRVVDEQQIDRHFNASQLAALYEFEPDSKSDRPTPMVPNDRLLAEMLIRNKDWIVNYHEHDSLLQNSAEEELTEEERQSAWNEYENEKEGLLNNLSDANVINPEMFEELAAEPNQDFAEEVNLPDLNEVVQFILKKINVAYPTASTTERTQKLLENLCQLRQVYQTKHVKILRVKQDYVARGIVRAPMNKYLEDLGKLTKALTLYITTLNVQLDAIRKQTFQQYMRMQQAQQAMPNMYAQFQGQRVPNPQFFSKRGGGIHYAQNVNFRNMNQGYSFVNARSAQPNVIGRNAMYNQRYPADSRPVITEVEEITPDSTTNATDQGSSVVITEID